ncbi:MAG: hypothetical protein JWN75_1201 [Candidatus Saccharibacteria bacterium]|nr:hypothetical protein [Candidatus Saccharibacteria bacterium]
MESFYGLWGIALFFLPAIIAYTRHASPAIPLILCVSTFIVFGLFGALGILIYIAAWVSAFSVSDRRPGPRTFDARDQRTTH